MILRTALSLLLLGPALAASARAEPATPTPPPQTAERQALEKFAADHKDCREWSDGCMVCIRHDPEKFGCSLPGVACQPTALACRDPAPADSKTPDTKPLGEPKK